jgi:hypothetical protein
VLQGLQANGAELDLTRAVLVLSVERGNVWMAPSRKSETCVVERLAPPRSKAQEAITWSRFACRPAALAATEGIVSGVQGEWVALKPSDAAEVSVLVGKERRTCGSLDALCGYQPIRKP